MRVGRRPIVIATRLLEFTGLDGAVLPVVVKFRKPVPSRSCEDTYECEYEIIGPGARRKVMRMVGVDSLQALILSTHVVLAELDYIAQRDKGRFSYLGSNNLALPEPSLVPK